MKNIDWWSDHRTKEKVIEYLKSNENTSSLSYTEFIKSEVPLEKNFQTRIIKRLNELKKSGNIDRNAIIWKNTSGSYSKSGLPDITMIADGKYYGFEVKRPLLGVPSRLQLKMIEDIEKAGGYAGIVSFEDEVWDIIERSRR